MKLTEAQKETLIAFIWDSLSKTKGHPDRRNTTWGSKTKIGLIACIERIIE